MKEGVFSGTWWNVFIMSFAFQGDVFPAVFLYCSAGVRSRICWYLCHAEARLAPWSSLPLFFSPTATFDLAGCHPKNRSNFQTCHPHTQNTLNNCVLFMSMGIFSFIHGWHGRSLSPLQRIHIALLPIRYVLFHTDSPQCLWCYVLLYFLSLT